MRLKYILLICSILILQGCTYRIITDYKNCVSEDLVFEFKDNLKLYIIDDTNAEYKYSSMNLPKGEHYLCVGEEDECIKEFSSEYYNLIPIESKPFHLTGTYKVNRPNIILGAFVSETSAIQIEINGIKTWVALYELDEDNLKKSSEESLKKLNKNTKVLNGWHKVFECPNTDVKKDDWELVFFN